jgi:chemotaxis protein histidine kinase CheA
MGFDHRKVSIAQFVEESMSGLNSILPLVTEFVPEKPDRDKLGAFLKVIHCIKGTSAIFPFRKLVGITRAVEDLVVGILENRIWLTGEVIGTLVDSTGAIRQILMQIDREYEEGLEDYMGLIGKLRGLGVRAAPLGRSTLDSAGMAADGARKAGQAMTVVPISKKTAQRLSVLVGDFQKLQQEFMSTSEPASRKLQGLVTTLDSELKTILSFLNQP